MKVFLAVSSAIIFAIAYSIGASSSVSLPVNGGKDTFSLRSWDGTLYQDDEWDGDVDFIVFPEDTIPNKKGVTATDLYELGFPVDTTLSGPRAYFVQRPVSVMFVGPFFQIPEDNGENGTWYVPRNSYFASYWQYRFCQELKKITFT